MSPEYVPLALCVRPELAAFNCLAVALEFSISPLLIQKSGLRSSLGSRPGRVKQTETQDPRAGRQEEDQR